MKKTLLFLTSILILSCVSLPNPSETNTGMVAFYHELTNEADIEIFGQYRITIEGVDSDYKTTLRMPKSTSVTKFYLKPGKYKISKMEFVRDNNAVENMFDNQQITGTLHVEEGKIIILELIMRTSTRIDGDKVYMNYGATKATPEEIKKVKQKIMAIDGSDLWEFK